MECLARVTPRNGTRITATSNPYTDSGRPQGPNYYVVTALTSSGESAPSPEAQVTLTDGISFTILGLSPTTLIGDTLHLEVSISSRYEIATAVVDVEGRREQLTINSTTSAWEGLIVLTGLSVGDHRAMVTVADVNGNSAQGSVAFRYHPQPRLVVTAPLQYTVGVPAVRVTASCQNAGCSRFRVVEVARYGSTQELATFLDTAATALDADVSLAGGSGTIPDRRAYIAIIGSNAVGQADTVQRVVFVLVSQALHEVVTVPGYVYDFEPGRVLYLDSTSGPPALKLRDLATRADANMLSQSGFQATRAALIPGGVLAVDQSQPDPVLYEWRSGTLKVVGVPFYGPWVAANFAVWEGDVEGRNGRGYQTPTLRDLAAGTNAILPRYTNTICIPLPVPNGDVVYGGTAIYRYRGGTETQITSISDTTINQCPVTDGSGVLYTKFGGVPNGAADTWLVRVALWDGTTERILTPTMTLSGFNPAMLSAFPILGAAMNAGWAAYLQVGSGGQYQVWTRSPTGEQRQVSFFSTSSAFGALGPNGEVAFANDRLYWNTPPYAVTPVAIGPNIGKVVFRGSAAYVLIGRSVFQVVP